MPNSTEKQEEEAIGGFTPDQIADVTKTVLKGLTDGAGRPIEWDKLTDSQKDQFVYAARKSITGEKTTGFGRYLLEGYRDPDKRTLAEKQEFEAQLVAVQHLEEEFGKLTRNEFDKRRSEN